MIKLPFSLPLHRKNNNKPIEQSNLPEKTTQITPEPIEEPQKESHQHDFELIIKTYASPQHTVLDKNLSLNEKTLEKAICGITTLLWKCKICDETKKEEILGSDENQLEELIEKVRQFGSQTFKIGEETFLMGKVPPQNTIPVR